jgi:hypothetical protein
MLEDPAELADRGERRVEAASIIADPMAIALLIDEGELTPPRARRMRDDGVWAGVETCVALLVPRVDVGEPEVGAVRRDEQCS